MTIKNLKKGFTLIELVVVMAIFAVLAVVAANFLIATVSTNNRVTVENNVRQTATLLMEDIASEIRKGSCVSYDTGSKTLAVSNAPMGTPGCAGSTYTLTSYNFSATPVMKTVGGVASAVTPDSIVFCSVVPTCNTTCTNGASININSGSADIILYARQINNTSRVDSCAKVTVSETVTPRNVGN